MVFSTPITALYTYMVQSCFMNSSIKTKQYKTDIGIDWYKTENEVLQNLVQWSELGISEPDLLMIFTIANTKVQWSCSCCKTQGKVPIPLECAWNADC